MLLFKNSPAHDSCAPWPGGDLWSTPSRRWTSCLPVALTPHFHDCSGESCARWMHYSEATKARESWARSLLDEFKSNVEMLKCAARDQKGTAPAHSSPQHGTHTCSYWLWLGFSCASSLYLGVCLFFFHPPVYVRDDVYGPLGSQDRSGEGGGERGVGLREADEGFLEWSSFTGPPAQCCWCLEPGTAVCTSVCLRTVWCGDTHLEWAIVEFHWREEALVFFFSSCLFTYVASISPPFAGRISTASSSSFSPPPPQSPRTQLMSSSVVLRMADFSIYQVT